VERLLAPGDKEDIFEGGSGSLLARLGQGSWGGGTQINDPEISCKQSLFPPVEDPSCNSQRQGIQPGMKKGDRLTPGARVRGESQPKCRPQGLSYLGRVGTGDPAVSPRLRKAARTFSVSSRSPSSSEPAMEAPGREGIGMDPGFSWQWRLGSKLLVLQ
jgi:hypothetical protein